MRASTLAILTAAHTAACGGAVAAPSADASAPASDAAPVGFDAARDVAVSVTSDGGAAGGDATTDAMSPPPIDAGCPSAASYFDGGCGDPRTDPHNCGGCGRDCMGGACDDGGCVPLPSGVLATGQLAPIALASDGHDVYWLNAGAQMSPPYSGGLPMVTVVGAQILKCAGTGCDNAPTALTTFAPTFFASVGGLPVAPTALAVDATNVYITTQGAVLACSVDGCGCSPTVVASGQSQPPGVAIGAGRVLWSVRFNGWPFTGTIESCPLGGCAGAPTTIASGQGGPIGLTADDASVYWVDTSTDGGGALLTRAFAGGAPTVLWTNSRKASAPLMVANDASNLYWTVQDNGGVYQCAKTDCAGTVIALATGVNAVGLAVDATNVYWRQPDVYRCAIGGCAGAPTKVASASSSNFGADEAIAVDAARVYWTQDGLTPDDSQIMWAAK